MSGGLNNKLIRCAIYTRKSHEEGLEQEFNSLDAQRESAEAYIKSQLHEGWQLIKTKYDDGGFSGGNMKRPALTKLLDDIRYNKIDIVVVYKVDRLSRSLSDFSRLIELFDEHKVSFVSVTQQFNTSNSMGRLTLNMLLSFAQFEREVTGERIRDKIEASKKKGLWMGGNPPMGYKVENRKLIVIDEEAEFVKQCFESYLDTPSILTLVKVFSEKGYSTKRWLSAKGKWHGGKRLTPKYIYRILTNPIYIGKISHKGKIYEGEHQAIIEMELWEKIQLRMKKSKQNKNTSSESPYLLKGKFRHYEGYAMSPSTFRKKHKNGTTKETRYYVSQKAIKQGYKKCDVKSINAEHIENIVIAVLVYLFELEGVITRTQIGSLNSIDSYKLFSKLIRSVDISPEKIIIEVSKEQIYKESLRLVKSFNSNKKNRFSVLPTLIEKPNVIGNGDELVVTLNVSIKKRDRSRFILDRDGKMICRFCNHKPNRYILKAFEDACRWRKILEENSQKTAKKIAKEEGVNYSLMLRKLMLLCLSPGIQKDIMTGRCGQNLQLKVLLSHSNNLSWIKQSQQIMFKY